MISDHTHWGLGWSDWMPITTFACRLIFIYENNFCNLFGLIYLAYCYEGVLGDYSSDDDNNPYDIWPDRDDSYEDFDPW